MLAMSSDANEIPFLRYRTGERIKVGDFVRELVDDRERNGTVDRVYDPGSIAAEVFGLLRGFCSITWSDRPFPILMTPDDIRQTNTLFVHRGDPRQQFRYRTGERIELGDVVMEPVNSHERFGTIEEVFEPGSSLADSLGYPHGCFRIRWCGADDLMTSPEFVQQPDVLCFVRRGNAPLARP